MYANQTLIVLELEEIKKLLSHALTMSGNAERKIESSRSIGIDKYSIISLIEVFPLSISVEIS